MYFLLFNFFVQYSLPIFCKTQKINDNSRGPSRVNECSAVCHTTKRSLDGPLAPAKVFICLIASLFAEFLKDGKARSQ